MKFRPLGPKGHPMHDVVHLEFSNKYDMGMTFVRMQEWYESPKFHHKSFTLEEFMRWYSLKQGKGVFTYTDDWSGFNIPSTAVEAVLNMPSPSHAELKLFRVLIERGLIEEPNNTNGRLWTATRPFYLIATQKGADPSDLRHEAAHGRFFIYPDYRQAVEAAVKKADIKPLRDALYKLGYSKWTLVDEVHAYALTGWPNKIKFKPNASLRALRRELRRIAGWRSPRRGRLRTGGNWKSAT